MRFAGFSRRKFRPHQCPICEFSSEKNRFCDQSPKKPFLVDSTDRNCRHFNDITEEISKNEV